MQIQSFLIEILDTNNIPRIPMQVLTFIHMQNESEYETMQVNIQQCNDFFYFERNE